MTKLWLEYDLEIFTTTNINIGTWPKNSQRRTLTIEHDRLATMLERVNLGIRQLAIFKTSTDKTLGKLHWISKIPLQRRGMAALSKIIYPPHLETISNIQNVSGQRATWEMPCALLKVNFWLKNFRQQFVLQVTENVAQNKKCLMLHNIDPMFNIR